jgi:hypothetical protein
MNLTKNAPTFQSIFWLTGQPLFGTSREIKGMSSLYTRDCPKVSATPFRQWGFRQYLPFSWTTLRGKHCRHPIAVMGVVDMFEHYLPDCYL